MTDTFAIRLARLPGRWTVARLPPGAEALPDDAFAVVRTPEETSLVVAEGAEPQEARAEGPWSMIAVAGPIPFETTGVIAAIGQVLARAGVPIFVISTFDTDYVLLPAGQCEAGITALEAAGMPVGPGVEQGRG